MKGLLLIALVFCCASSHSQSSKDSILTFTGIIKVDSASKEQLFTRARQWFNASLRDARTAIRVADKETGEILAKCIVRSQHWYKAMGKEYKVPIEYDFDLSVYVKDGKYKYSFSNFVDHEVSSIKYMGPLIYTSTYPGKGYRSKDIMDKIWVSQQKELAITVNELIDGLKDTMGKPISDF